MVMWKYHTLEIWLNSLHISGAQWIVDENMVTSGDILWVFLRDSSNAVIISTDSVTIEYGSGVDVFFRKIL